MDEDADVDETCEEEEDGGVVEITLRVGEVAMVSWTAPAALLGLAVELGRREVTEETDEEEEEDKGRFLISTLGTRVLSRSISC